MKKTVVFIMLIAFMITISFVIIYSGEETNFNLNDTDTIKPSYVFAIIKCDENKNANAFLMPNENSKIVANFKNGDNVRILQDKSYKWYLVIPQYENKVCGWVKKEFLLIPDDPETNMKSISDYEVEKYVNDKGFQSKTNLFVLVEIDRQTIYVFNGRKENWKIIKRIKCGTGKNISPTTTGLFKITKRGKWFYSERLNSGAMYWLKFNGSYLFHSVAMDKNKNITDNTIGKRCSSGCVRMSVEDAKWFYENIPENTAVFVL